MKVIKKIILFVYNLIVGSIFKLLLWGLMAGVVFGVCIFFPPSHWINVLDSERLTEEQAVEIAPEITLKWATETSKLITREKAATVKAGTKVKVLGVFDVFAEGVLWHIYYDEAQYLIQLPDGSKVIAKLPEAAKLARAIVLKTGDTVNVLDVNKKRIPIHSRPPTERSTSTTSSCLFRPRYRYTSKTHFKSMQATSKS